MEKEAEQFRRKVLKKTDDETKETKSI